MNNLGDIKTIIISGTINCPFKSGSDNNECNILKRMGAVCYGCESYGNTIPENCPLLRTDSITVSMQLGDIKTKEVSR